MKFAINALACVGLICFGAMAQYALGNRVVTPNIRLVCPAGVHSNVIVPPPEVTCGPLCQAFKIKEKPDASPEKE